MPVLMPELCQYLRLTNVNSYAWLMPILTPDMSICILLLCQYLCLTYANIYTWNMRTLTPVLWHYVYLKYANTYAWLMPIHMPDLYQYLCVTYAKTYDVCLTYPSTYAWHMRIHTPDLCQYLCPSYVNNYAWLMLIRMPDLCQYLRRICSRCATEQTCINDWWLATSNNPACSQSAVTSGHVASGVTCLFCCHEETPGGVYCNSDLYPQYMSQFPGIDNTGRMTRTTRST